MREIKFRQFIGGGMIYWGFLEGAFMGPSANGANSENAQNTPQMQYTGLKDKNGKEIYEGDIVKFPSISGQYLTGEVAYEINNANFTYCTMRGAEIIGNIYENTNLLNHD